MNRQGLVVLRFHMMLRYFYRSGVWNCVDNPVDRVCPCHFPLGRHIYLMAIGRERKGVSMVGAVLFRSVLLNGNTHERFKV